MLVCRRWRALALDTPGLWNVIDVGLPSHSPGPTQAAEIRDPIRLARLSFLLFRSSTIPLDLLIRDAACIDNVLPIITPHYPRVRFLTVSCDNAEDAGGVSSLLAMDMPLLAGLNVMYDRSISADDVGTVVLNRYPLLRILRLYYAVFTEELTITFVHLQVLDLRICETRGQPSTFSALLDLLARCPDLVELRLHKIISPLPTTAGPYREPRPVHLRRLQELTLLDTPTNTRQLLSHLSFPLDASLEVIGVLNFPDPLANLPAVFTSLFPSDLTRIPLLGAITELEVAYFEGIQLTGKCGPAELKLDLEWDDFTRPDLRGCLGTVGALFAGAGMSLRELSVIGGPDDTLDNRTWPDCLSRLLRLEKLYVSCPGLSPASLFEALVSVVPESIETDPVLICPNLQELTIRSLHRTPQLVATLTAVMQHRMEHGAARLKTLEVHMRHAHGGSCPLPGDAPREDLARYVDTLRINCSHVNKR